MQHSVTLVLVCLLFFVACDERQPDSTGDADSLPEAAPVVAESLVSDTVHFQFAVYYLPRPSHDPIAVLDMRLAASGHEMRRVDAPPEQVTESIVGCRLQDNVATTYAPPDVESLRYFGRGLAADQALELQLSEQALVLDFVHPGENVWVAYKTATELVHSIAVETGGLIWDEETRELFTPEQWREQRDASLSRQWLDIRDHITIHAYSTGEFVRAITLGMGKFGLPDVVVQAYPRSRGRNVGHLINLMCQLMAEGVHFSVPAEFDLRIEDVKHPVVREEQLSSLGANAEGAARLSLTRGEWEEGDPVNRLIQIGFGRNTGPDEFAQQEAALGALFGWEDSISHIEHTEELLKASEAARQELPALYKAFVTGLGPGEFINVKAPFATPGGGQEWMWVEITHWEADGTIKGLLANEPFEIPDMHAGQIVTVQQSDVFDYIRRYPDGSSKGNTTSAIIEKMNQ